MTGGSAVGELGVFFSRLEEAICLACLRNSAVKSWASLDLLPTLAKGRTVAFEEEEREEKPVLMRSSVFSLRREPALWGPAEHDSLRGMV